MKCFYKDSLKLTGFSLGKLLNLDIILKLKFPAKFNVADRNHQKKPLSLA